MKLKRIVSILLAAVMLFAMAPVSFAGSTMGTAESVTVGTAKKVTMKEDNYWYKFKADTGQFITVSGLGDNLSVTLWDKDENKFSLSWDDATDDRHGMAEAAGTYYLKIVSRAAQTVTFTVTLTDNDAYEPNNTQAAAVAVEPGVEYEIVCDELDDDWFVLEAQPGQIVMVECSEGFGVSFRDSEGEALQCWNSENGLERCFAPADGAVYLSIWYDYWYGSDMPWIESGTFTVTVIDNDACENNNTEETAYELTSGVPAAFQLGYYDTDWFAIDLKAGQDVKLELGGFNYATRGTYYFGTDANSYGDLINGYTVNGNRTDYYHAAEDGLFTFCACSYYDNVNKTNRSTETFTVTATVLEGDENEPNDSLTEATRLPIGTDDTFVMGGAGDEDWFTFEAALDEGKSSKLYTLNLLDLNSDYSDTFCYDLYAPNGDKLMSAMKVNYRHINVLACEQEGLYALRLYRESTTSPRTELRIRVDEGGADPYEPNDTWLAAAEVEDGQPVQYILSNTADEDWFKIRVPRANMTLSMNWDNKQRYYLYSADMLEEFGTEKYLSYNYNNVSGTYCYQFTDPGVYYLRLFAETGYVSQDLRTMVLTLEDARDNEPNNTWKTATPIYEGAPMAYDLSASNDDDWFKFDVPEGVSELRIADGYGYKYLYRGSDFEIAGDNAAYITYVYGSDLTLKEPAAGAYYVRCSGDRSMGRTITYHLVMEEGEPIAEGRWLEGVSDDWYVLLDLKAGDELRIYSDKLEYVRLYDADGTLRKSVYIARAQDMYTMMTVPEDGDYRLKVEPWFRSDSYGYYRLLVDIADRELEAGESFVLEGPDTVTIAVREDLDLTFRVAPYDAKGAGQSISRTVADTSVIASGYTDLGYYLYGKAVGTTTVEYSIGDDITKTVTVNVVESTSGTAQSVAIENAPKELTLGTSAQLKAVLTPAYSDDGIAWTSSDPKVLYVNTVGKVIAVGDGTATITATAASGVSASVTITVTDAPAKPEVTGLTLDRYDMTLYMGEAGGKLTAAVAPAGSTATVGWVSSNLKAATVDQEGNITPVSPGVTVITASAGDYRASCIVTVQPDRVNVESIAFDTAVLELPMGGESTLRPVFTPYDATVQSVTWVSSDPNVATVSRTGIVHAIMGGETTVTATTLDGGKQASILIRVIAAPQLGDINADGYVDAADAMITLQVAVGKVELNDVQFEAADVNRDGWVDAADAVRILRFDAGLIESLN
ncbi:MAG: Ig-like domain-containing protein [Clostridia bacterium]|nr:Ig-like domain-containing protein [Clostridia bacterium]